MSKQSEWDITVEHLKDLREQGAEFVLVDVREPAEYEKVNLGGRLIPLGQLAARIDEIEVESHVVVHCKSGGRSAKAVEILRASGFGNAWNVQGGMIAWVERIDPSLPKP
jgi:sulfur-carrier protein adenylyltransferase/sulfurtransferase